MLNASIVGFVSIVHGTLTERSIVQVCKTLVRVLQSIMILIPSVVCTGGFFFYCSYEISLPPFGVTSWSAPGGVSQLSLQIIADLSGEVIGMLPFTYRFISICSCIMLARIYDEMLDSVAHLDPDVQARVILAYAKYQVYGELPDQSDQLVFAMVKAKQWDLDNIVRDINSSRSN